MHYLKITFLYSYSITFLYSIFNIKLNFPNVVKYEVNILLGLLNTLRSSCLNSRQEVWCYWNYLNEYLIMEDLFLISIVWLVFGFCAWTHFLAFMEWADDIGNRPAAWSYVPVQSSSCSLRVFHRTLVGKDTY